MKALKLILLFAVILGGVVAALWFSVGGDDDLIGGGDFDDIKALTEEFENDWKKKGDWDADLFRSHVEIINQASIKHDTKNLKDLNTEIAVEIVSKKIFDEWKKASCSKAVVDKYYGAVGTIEAADANAKSNSNFQKIKSIYATYKDICAFLGKGVGLNPTFNGSSWNSYSAYGNEMKNKANAYKSNTNYKEYLSGISSLSNGLNSIPGKVDAGRRTFYDTLAQRIISYYRGAARTENNLERLYDVRRKYNSEYHSNGDLNRFVSDFEDGVLNI